MPTNERFNDRSASQNSGDAGFIQPEIIEYKTTQEDLDTAQNCGNFGEYPPGYETMPGVRGVGYLGKDTQGILTNPSVLKKEHPAVYHTIIDLQSKGKTIHAKWDAHKGTILFVGSAVALGAVGGLVLKEYKRRHK
jgi:hypothetical protein